MFYNKEFVYFITDGDGIKIGYSARNVASRIMALQVGNPRPLKLLGVIPCTHNSAYNKEQELHKKFFQYKTVGGGTEWFKDDSSIHLEYKRALYDHDLFNVLDEYIKNLNKFNTGINSHIFHWVRDNIIELLPTTRTTVVIAPPKSGKRIMAQSCVLLYPHAKHVFITAQNKKDIKPQKKEHKNMGLIYISATNLSEEYDQIIDRLKKELGDYDGEIVIHFDECDFGSEKSKNINTKSVYNRLQEIVSSRTNVKYISYSATPEEAVFANPDYTIVYKPAASYVGPNHYFDNSIEAEKFFIVDESGFNFSSQGVEALKYLANSEKQFGVVRISYNEGKRKQFHSYLKDNEDSLIERIKDLGLPITPIFIDQSNSEQFPWFYKEKDDKGNFEMGFWSRYHGKYLIIINKVAERGTEIGYHPDIAFWHEWAGNKTSYATAGQRIGRVFYYSTYYDKNINPDYDCTDFRREEANIRLYCNRNVLKAMKDAYSAKDGREFKSVWEKAELDRPIGNAKRLENSKSHDKYEYKLFETYNEAREAFKNQLKNDGLFNEKDWEKKSKYRNTVSGGLAHDMINIIRDGRLPPGRGVSARIIHIDGPCKKYADSYLNYIKDHPNHEGKYLLAIPSKNNKGNEVRTKNSIHNTVMSN